MIFQKGSDLEVLTMNCKGRRSIAIAWLAAATWLLPAVPATATTSPIRTTIWDVRLNEQHTLQGRLVDLEGGPLANRQLHLLYSGTPIAQTTSDAEGRFEFSQVSVGMYQLRFDSYAVNCRVWSPRTAPPAARPELVVLAAPDTIRGQQPLHAVFRNPLFIGLVIAAAVAIPLATQGSKKDLPPAS